MIDCESNHKGLIEVDNIFGIGKKQNGKQRPLVVSLTQQMSKKLIINNTGNSIKKYSLPSEMRERCTIQKRLFQKIQRTISRL